MIVNMTRWSWRPWRPLHYEIITSMSWWLGWWWQGLGPGRRDTESGHKTILIRDLQLYHCINVSTTSAVSIYPPSLLYLRYPCITINPPYQFSPPRLGPDLEPELDIGPAKRTQIETNHLCGDCLKRASHWAQWRSSTRYYLVLILIHTLFRPRSRFNHNRWIWTLNLKCHLPRNHSLIVKAELQSCRVVQMDHTLSLLNCCWELTFDFWRH